MEPDTERKLAGYAHREPPFANEAIFTMPDRDGRKYVLIIHGGLYDSPEHAIAYLEEAAAVVRRHFGLLPKPRSVGIEEVVVHV